MGDERPNRRPAFRAHRLSTKGPQTNQPERKSYRFNRNYVVLWVSTGRRD